MKASLPAQKAGKEAFTAFSAGRLSARFGAERVLPVGYSTAALGAFGFLLLDGSTPYWLAAAVFAGLGVGQW